MKVGPEAFVTSDTGETTELPKGNKVVIPPGQFGLLVTQETVRIPANVVAFISIRAGIKFRGLINVSGFHVDPGYHGQLRFAVYNAGSKNIVLDQGQRIFMIWFADLDETDIDPYPEQEGNGSAITADHVAAIQGDVASPAELKAQLDELRSDLDNKFHATEQVRLLNRALLMLVIGILVTVAITVFKPYLAPSQQEGMSEAMPAGVTPIPETEESAN
ncbi:dCTP deaminase domain-containing protein [Candidatus Palauibacter sp.]|uniref:dCTP deaminase domain-containing protein n=1 Tax=Candidatus Palauibacter sp. TaxID=3101350 RepID=UPI003B5BC509